MIQGLQSHPTYKSSGVDWLGDVPAHWEVRRLRTVAEMRVSNVDKHVKDGELPVRLCNYVDVYKNDRITEDIAFMRATATASETERFRLEVGDVLITKDSETWNDIGVPALVEHTADDLVCGYHLALLRPSKRSLDGAYLLRALQNPTIGYQFHISAKGVTRYGLTHEAVKSVLVPLPPLHEQRAIVRYLDHLDRHIQCYIEAKEKLIALLQEARQSIIQRAVTRGLDSDVPLKPSSLPWLPHIPAHWHTERGKRLFTKMKRSVRDSDEVVTCFRDGVVTLRKNRRTEGFTESLQEIGYQGIRLGDLVIHAMDAFAGAIGVADSAGKGTPVYSVCRPAPHADAYYFAYILREMARNQWIAALATGVRERSTDFRYATMASQWLPLPPLAEQRAIVAHLDQATEAIDCAIDNARRQSEGMTEYRASLIAHVVTGKLDVRAAAERIDVAT